MMARRNIFDNVMKAMEPLDESVSKPVAKFGAAKSISSSIDELARQASQLVEGESIVEIDTALIDASFVVDRMGEAEGSFEALVAAISERGQDSPVLLRPHPVKDGHYQIVFGHRRVRAVKVLGRPVKAVIRSLADIELVLAQGQENSVRSNLSFIERVLFAQRLTDRGFDREVVQSALSVDYQTLSKMLTIPKVVSAEIIDAIGVAKPVGRDRWLEFRKLLERPGNHEIALSRTAEPAFAMLSSEERFADLYGLVARRGKRNVVKKAIAPRRIDHWTSPDKAVAASISRTGSKLTLVLNSRSNSEFGDFVSTRLADLYAEFQADGKTKP
jgi:ParB family chromosome partitioning protein